MTGAGPVSVLRCSPGKVLVNGLDTVDSSLILRKVLLHRSRDVRMHFLPLFVPLSMRFSIVR